MKKPLIIILILIIFTIPAVSANNITIDPSSSIQDTINTLNTGDTLYLDEGTYKETGIEINKSINIEGLKTANQTIIDGEYKNSSIFTIADNIQVNFKNLKIINGNSPENGGAISSYNSPITIDNCIFKDNIAESFGGAIDIGNSTLTLNNSIFLNNLANYDGGAISVKRIPGSKVENCIFINNTAPTGWGGTFYNWYCGMTMNNVTIKLGNAELGGAIFNAGNLIITNSKLTNNKATYEGGAIYNYHNTVQVSNTIITNNTSQKGADVALYRTEKATNFDNNWWGINNPLNTTNYPLNWSKRFELDYDKTVDNPTKWLNLNTELTDNTLTIKLKNEDGKLSTLPLNVNIETETKNYTTQLINGENAIKLEKTTTNQTIKTTSYYQTLYNTLEPDNAEIKVIINSSSLIKTYNTNTEFKGKLEDEYGNPIIGQYLTIKLTRISSGANKEYSIVTDYSGEYTLPINLAIGEYSAIINYKGLNTSNKTYLPSGPVNETINVIEGNTAILLSPYKEAKNVNKNLTGKLVDIDSKPIIGQHINLKLTRLSSGANKVYDIVTKYDGEFILPINLAIGEYCAEAIFEGNGNYTRTKTTIDVVILP